MNKKYLSAILFGTLLAASTGTFTSCKDYDDDIKSLQEQIDGNISSVSALQTQLTALQTALTAAQADADAAQAAATAAAQAAAAAQATGDDALAAAQAAAQAAATAQAAAAQARVDAIAEATRQVTALQTLMEQAIALKVDQTVFDNAVTLLSAQIEGIQTGLSTLQSSVSENAGNIATNASDIQSAKDAIATLVAADVDLQLQLDALKIYAEATQDLATSNKEEIDAANAAIAAAQTEIAELWVELNGFESETSENLAGLAALINGNTSLIDALTGRVSATESDIESHSKLIEALESGLNLAETDIRNLVSGLNSTNENVTALETRINNELATVKADISTIQTDIRTINNQIIAINTDLVSLHTLVVCRLTSITFAPDYIVDGVEAIRFSSLQYAAMENDENAGIPTTYDISTAALATASYHFNPASFVLTNADYSYVDHSATVINTRAAASQWVSIDGAPVANLEKGTVDFKLLRLNVHATQPGKSEVNMIALQAALKGDAVDAGETNVVVTSPYVAIYDEVLDAKDIRIADKETLASAADEAHYATTFRQATTEEPRYTMTYNQVFNLKELVATCFGNGTHNEFPIEDYNLSYRFAVASSEYNITTGSTTTNQQTYFTCNSVEDGLFQANDFNIEAVGRTPIFKVELVDNNGNVVRRGFVKVVVGVEKQADITVGNAAYNLTIGCNDDVVTYEIDEAFIRENVYRKITNGRETGMSHEEFWNLYDASAAVASVTKKSRAYTMSVPKIVDGETGVGTATKKVVWSFTHEELGTIGTTSANFVATVTVKNKLSSSEYPDRISFQFRVNVILPTFELAKTENDVFWAKDGDEYKYFNINVQRPDNVNSPASECVYSTLLSDAYSAYSVTGLPDCVSSAYRVDAAFSGTENLGDVKKGILINNATISLDKTNTSLKRYLNSVNGLQAQISHVYTLNSGDEIVVNTFMVNFIRPVNLNMPSGLAVTDAVTGGDDVNFSWNGLLTDWRGEAIIAPYQELVNNITSAWQRVCQPDYTYTVPQYVVNTPASFSAEYGKFEMTTSFETTVYSGSVEVTFAHYGPYCRVVKNEVTFTSETQMLTQSDVNQDLEAKIKKYLAEHSGYWELNREKVDYVIGTVPASTTITYDYVKSFTYTPATYKWTDVTVTATHTHTEMPSYAGTKEGQTVGCWKWMSINNPTSVSRGQYYAYYGPFADNVTLNVGAATTDLAYNNGQLPNEAVLTQDGNTVKYENKGAKVGYVYHIYIPATISYGWGTVSSTLVLTVNPVAGN